MISRLRRLLFIFSSSIVVFSSAALPVFAEDQGWGRFFNRVEKREDKQASREARQAQNREEHIAKLKAVFIRILDKMGKILDRFSALQDKIEARIAKLSGEGKDVSAAQTALANAKVKKTAAQVAIGAAKANVDAVNSTSTRDVVMVAVGSLKSARDALHDYRTALKDTIKALKGIGGGATSSAKP